jgi:hypothetical protein
VVASHRSVHGRRFRALALGRARWMTIECREARAAERKPGIEAVHNWHSV